MATATSTTAGVHILVFPFPAQGHMLPLLDLSHQLSLRGVTITILTTPKNLPILTPLLSTHPTSIKPLVLPFPPHPSIPAGVENTKDVPPGGGFAIMRSLSELSDPILHWFRSHPSPPVAILSDFFLGWTQNLATELGIKRFVFSPSGAFAIAITHSLWRHMPKPPNDENALVSFPDLPNRPSFPWPHLSTMFRKYVEGDPDSELVKEWMRANTVSWGIVLNTFDEFESAYLDHLREDFGQGRVFAVGPVHPAARGGSSSVQVHELIKWLDTCPDRSVVYVCFGSQAVLNNRQTEVLAEGLEKSGTRFVWSMKQATEGHVEGEYGVLESGFEDRVAGRGFVIRGWAPQVAILNHRAVGSFLTHCGWNSVLEAVGAGVPMLTWAMRADQYFNANLLVDQVGVAVRVCEGVSTVPDANELARKVGEFAQKVSESVGEEIKRGKELNEAALKALKEGGSSSRSLDGLVRELQRIHRN